MKKAFLTACAILLGSISTMTAQVKLRADNIDEVLKAMTLEEKAMLVVGGNRRITSTADNGMIGGHAQRVPGAAGTTQSIPRLGIPSTVLTDGPAGVRINPRRDNDANTYFCTGFPVGTGCSPSAWKQRQGGVSGLHQAHRRHQRGLPLLHYHPGTRVLSLRVRSELYHLHL